MDSTKIEPSTQISHAVNHTNFLTSQTEARKRVLQSEPKTEQHGSAENSRATNLGIQDFVNNSNEVSTDSGVPPRRRSRSKGKQRNQKSKA